MSELKDLFEEWKRAHEEDDNWKNNFPKGSENTLPEKFKGNFVEDGKFGGCADKVKILFIARESNISEDITKGNYPTFGKFWMKKVVETMQENEKNGTRNYYGSNLKPNDKRAQTNYYNYLREICDDKNTTLSNCAYMNLNKRGGYGSCYFKNGHYTRLEEYIDNYEKLIQREIEILNPEMVVFLGYNKGYGDRVMKLIKNGLGRNVPCYAVYHPSYPKRKSSLDNLKKEITL